MRTTSSTFRALISATAGALLLGLSACAAAPQAAGNAASAGGVTLDESTVVLDVRTPAEYAEGHLDGATLLDFSGGELTRAIPSLDPAASYVIYCRSGNRSGQALAALQAAGFTDLTNLGSLAEAAAATGLPVVS